MTPLFIPPDQSARNIVITGTGGLGFQAAEALARAGANIVLAGRNAKTGAEAVARLKASASTGTVAFETVDLADLRSIDTFAARMLALGEPIDVLLNNAGIMSPPQLQLTAQGHEIQVGVNYLGHFALTARLLPVLRLRAGARVVNVTSLAQHHAKSISLGDLGPVQDYSAGRQYCLSKLLQAMFTAELQRRSEQNGWGVSSLAAHPGFAGTNLFDTGGGFARFIATRIVLPLIGQSAADGAAPLLFAATAPNAAAGKLYGPKGFMEMSGRPGECKFAQKVFDPELAAQVWHLSESLTQHPFAE